MSANNLQADAAWLHANLNNENVVVIDATTTFEAPTGRQLYGAGHIPGAVHSDLPGAFSDQSTDVPFMALPSEKFADAIAALGVSNDSHVVIYDQGMLAWATRLWWNLRLEGHDQVSVLDGGLPAWKEAGFEITTEVPSPAKGTFTANRRQELYATKEEVQAAVSDPDVITICALSHEDFTKGHIPGAVSVPMTAATTAAFEQVGAMDPNKRIITYCGGGISATLDAFRLAQAGRDDVAVYDGSLSEWNASGLPLES